MSEENEPSVLCAVVNCPNNFPGNDREDLTYHRFPDDPTMRSAWIRACLRPRHWSEADSSYVCSDHFDETDFEYSEATERYELRPEVIPSSKAKYEIKAEPVDMAEEFAEMLDDKGFEVIVNQANSSSIKMELDESQDTSYDESGYLNGNICKKCGREFKTNGRLKRHEMFCLPTGSDKKPKLGPRAGSGTTCFYKDCNVKFYHRNKMLKHMEVVHHCIVDEKQKLKFANMEEFWTWKENEEERTYSYFSKRTGNHKNTATYHCQRDGPSRARNNAAENSRAAKRQLTKGNIKENIVCLAHIKTVLNVDGTVSATYFPSHNHPLSAMDYLHHPLSRATQMFIKEKLELGYSPKQIADELLIRQNASGAENPNNMTKNQFLHMVNKLDRIRGFLDRERRRLKDEASGLSSINRKRRSRKAIFEEQFEKSRQFQEEVKSNRMYLDSDGNEFEDEESIQPKKLIKAEDYEELFDDDDSEVQVIDDELSSAVRDADEDETENDYLRLENLLKTPEGGSKEGDISKEIILEDTESPSSSKDYQGLYKDAIAANKRLASTVNDLRTRLSKKEQQVHLLISALKKTLSKDSSDDMAGLKETVSDGDYEIIVI